MLLQYNSYHIQLYSFLSETKRIVGKGGEKESINGENQSHTFDYGQNEPNTKRNFNMLL